MDLSERINGNKQYTQSARYDMSQVVSQYSHGIQSSSNYEQAENADGSSTSSDEVLYKSSTLALLKHKKKSKQDYSRSTTEMTANEKVESTMRCLEISQKLLDFVRQMWMAQKFCDMVLVLKNGEMLAHKVVFAAHSQILAEKFVQFPPDQIITIQLTDFSPKSVAELTQFLYTARLNLSVNNVTDIYKCAAELGLHSIFEYAREFLSNYKIPNAILFYNICDVAKIIDLREEIFAFICDHFSEIVQHESFGKVSLDNLVHLLTNNNLAVTRELDVFFAVCRWIDCDRRRRMSISHKLLNCVRFQLISPEDIVTKVCSVEWIFECKENIDIVNQAYKFHSLKATGSHLVARFPVQTPRARTTAGATGLRKKSSAHLNHTAQSTTPSK